MCANDKGPFGLGDLCCTFVGEHPGTLCKYVATGGGVDAEAAGDGDE